MAEHVREQHIREQHGSRSGNCITIAHDNHIDSDALNFVVRSPDKTEKVEDQSFGRVRAEADKMHQMFPLSEALVAQAGEHPFVTPQKGKRKAAAAESATAQKTRRLIHFDGLKLTELDIRRSVVPSVVVPSFQSVMASHCIPLWPQFKASWFGVDLEDRIWLELKLLVSASVGKSMRNVVTQKCWLAVKNEFDTQMTKQRIKMHMRVNNDLNDPSASDDKEETSKGDETSERDLKRLHAATKFQRHRHACVSLTFGDYTVVCLNNRRRILIELEDGGVQFIRHWLQPLILASYPALAKRVAPVEAIVARSPVDRSLPLQLATPNIENKIRWHARKNAWAVKAKKTVKKDQFQVMFEEEDALRDDDFLKIDEGGLEWNRCDHSTRRRIRREV